LKDRLLFLSICIKSDAVIFRRERLEAPISKYEIHPQKCTRGEPSEGAALKQAPPQWKRAGGGAMQQKKA
jgi:hypothetical protein